VCALAKGEQVEQLRDIIAPACVHVSSGPRASRRSPLPPPHLPSFRRPAHLTLWSPLSSRKLARIDALSFWMTARSSAIVLAARTLRINCLTAAVSSSPGGGHGRATAYVKSWPRRVGRTFRRACCWHAVAT
jgi:hypothetical protein